MTGCNVVWSQLTILWYRDFGILCKALVIRGLHRRFAKFILPGVLRCQNSRKMWNFCTRASQIVSFVFLYGPCVFLSVIFGNLGKFRIGIGVQTYFCREKKMSRSFFRNTCRHFLFATKIFLNTYSDPKFPQVSKNHT